MYQRDDAERTERRASYAAYAPLQWELYRLPSGHPARRALNLAVAQADRYWRALVASALAGRGAAIPAAPDTDAASAPPPSRLVHLGHGAWPVMPGAPRASDTDRLLDPTVPLRNPAEADSTNVRASIKPEGLRGMHFLASISGQPGAVDD